MTWTKEREAEIRVRTERCRDVETYAESDRRELWPPEP